MPSVLRVETLQQRVAAEGREPRSCRSVQPVRCIRYLGAQSEAVSLISDIHDMHTAPAGPPRGLQCERIPAGAGLIGDATCASRIRRRQSSRGRTDFIAIIVIDAGRDLP